MQTQFAIYDEVNSCRKANHRLINIFHSPWQDTTGSDFFEKACNGSYIGINIIVCPDGRAHSISGSSACECGKFVFINDR